MNLVYVANLVVVVYLANYGNLGESGGCGDSLILVILMNLAQLVIWVNLLDNLHSEYGGSGGPG